jgi:ParB family chromosome partitioning protein
MMVKIADIIVGKRHRREMGDISQLAKSIDDIGLLHPIVVDSNRNLIVGGRRLEAVKFLGRDENPGHGN